MLSNYLFVCNRLKNVNNFQLKLLENEWNKIIFRRTLCSAGQMVEMRDCSAKKLDVWLLEWTICSPLIDVRRTRLWYIGFKLYLNHVRSSIIILNLKYWLMVECYIFRNFDVVNKILTLIGRSVKVEFNKAK